MLTTSSQLPLNEIRNFSSFTTYSEMLSEPKGQKLRTLQCKGFKPPVARGHATARQYWLDAFGHCGHYKETIVRQEDGSNKLIAEGNPLNAPGQLQIPLHTLFSVL